MSKIILIHPPLKYEQLYSSFQKAGSELPPLGLAYLAGTLKKYNFDVEIIDAQALNLNNKEIINFLFKKNPSYIGLSSYSVGIYNTAELAEEIKREFPKIPLIIGGGHITAFPHQTMQEFPFFDVGVIGEGEETIVELLNSLENKNSQDDVKGIIFRKNGEIKINSRRHYIENLDTLPFPAWDLLPDITKYYFPPADSINRLPSTSLITSRGCPGKCIFCNRTIFGNVTRSHSVNYIMEEIFYLINTFKIKEIFFQDDTFFVHREILKELCEKLIERKLDLSFCCYGRVDMVDVEILKLMKKAGFWQISYGIETGSQKILDFTKKGTTLEQIENAVKWTKESKIKVKGLFMLGNFLETKETIKETINLIRKLPLDDFHMTYFTPFPGSLSYKIAKDYGEFNSSLKTLSFFSPTFIPKDLTKDELEYYYRLIYRIFYLRLKIIFYYLIKLKNKKVIMKLLRSLFSFLRFSFRRNL